ncbi:MAG: DUF2585 family protein [bacterium]
MKVQIMKGCRPGWVVALFLVATTCQLIVQGRVWWCTCGRWNLWAGDIWSAHNSQHVFDPYSFTHLLHGVAFFWILTWLFKRLTFPWMLTLTILMESVWEVAENTAFIIQRYREATIGLGYEGDSIINSLSDILCCTAGFILARHLGFRIAITMFVLIEVFLAIIVRDNLTLNVLMLICPIDAIKQWQMVH